MEKTLDSNLDINKLKKKNVLKNLIKMEILKIQTKIRVKTEFRETQISSITKMYKSKQTDLEYAYEIIISTDIYLNVSKKIVANLRLLLNNINYLFGDQKLSDDIHDALMLCHIFFKFDTKKQLFNLIDEITQNHKIIINDNLTHEILVYYGKEGITKEDIQQKLPFLKKEFKFDDELFKFKYHSNQKNNNYDQHNKINISNLQENKMNNIYFIKIPEYLNSMKNKINGAPFKNIYSEFSFLYLPISINVENSYKNEKEIVMYLFNYLKNFKFIAFHYQNSNVLKDKKIINEFNIQNSSSQIIEAIFCVEQHCIIIENIECKLIKIIIDKLINEKISLINATKCFNFEKLTNEEIKTNEEIDNFIKTFHQEIERNELIKYTIRSIICYLIRRYFYPTNYFKNVSFFSFIKQMDSREQELRIKLADILFTKDMNKISKNILNLRKLIHEVKLSNEKNDKVIQFKEFIEKDFVKLRKIYWNENSIFYLVIHIKSLYIFMMKKIYFDENNKDIEHEKYFCNFFSHRCFVKFYGFVKEKGNVIGFIYEYMSNNSLMSFIENQQNPIDNLYLLTIINRIFQGIKYLNIHSLVHRDLKPSNILLDHDYLPYISDFETIKKLNDKQSELNISKNSTDIGSLLYLPPEVYFQNIITINSDIFSFGLIIFYLFEQKHMMKLNDNLIDNKYTIDMITNASTNMKKIYQSCVQLKPNERMTNDEIQKRIIIEINSFFKQKVYLKQLTYNSFVQYAVNFLVESMYIDIDNPILKNFFQIVLKTKEYNELFNKQDNSDIFLYLGNLFYNGIIVEKDYIQAKECYEFSSSLKNNSISQLYLGNLYFNGYGVEQNYLQAKYYYELSLKQNNPNALIKLGNLYLYGKGIQQDYLQAKKYFKLSNKISPNSDICLILGYIYGNKLGNKRNDYKAKKYYELSNKIKPNSSALFNLGYLFENGYGVVKDYLQAKHYYELSGQLNNSMAFFNIGNIFENGYGVKKDYLQAKYYYELSARLNNSMAILKLGTFYEKGLGVEQNYIKARYYYELSARLNNSHSFLNLGTFYEKGLGVEQSYIKARYYYELSAQLNNTDALFKLADLYSDGTFDNNNINKAIKYFLKCQTIQYQNENYSNHDFTTPYFVYNYFYYRSFNNLGLIYLLFFDDIEKSNEFIKISAFGEFPYGQNNFGLLNQFYLNNIDMAEYMYKKSSKYKFALAEFNLGYMYEKRNKIEESIQFYIKSSEHENEPLVFQKKNHYDLRLEISKTFLLCFTNLKLTHYFLLLSKYDESKKYFIKSIEKLQITNKNLNYKFEFQFGNPENENNFSYLKKYFFLFPQFNEINQPYPFIQYYLNNNFKSKNYQQKSNDQILKIDLNELTIKDKIKNNKMIDYFKTFSDPGELFDFIIKNNNLKSMFINEINDIIYLMKSLIYTPPYHFLFGRINLNRNKEKNQQKPINQSFYEGFRI